MKIVELEQGSQTWLDWRKTRVCASDVPIIVGESKWCTPLLLWKRKLGFAPEQSDNFGMARGRQLEPKVRDMVNEKMEACFSPVCGEHDDLEWAGASLDGYDYTMEAILEIKCPGLDDHKVAESDEIPSHYYPQVQWQLFVADLELCYYASYYEGELVIVEVERDDDYIEKKLLTACAEFKFCLTNMEQPPHSEKDFIQITDALFGDHARDWLAAKEMLKHYEEKEKYFREKLIGFTDDSNCHGYGVRLQRINRDGNIDYKKINADIVKKYPDLEMEFKPESYRKEGIGFWKVSADK